MTMIDLRIKGCGRDADNEKALVLYFNRKPTDDELRALYDNLRREYKENLMR
jgi:hypothetical protein